MYKKLTLILCCLFTLSYGMEENNNEQEKTFEEKCKEQQIKNKSQPITIKQITEGLEYQLKAFENNKNEELKEIKKESENQFLTNLIISANTLGFDVNAYNPNETEIKKHDFLIGKENENTPPCIFKCDCNEELLNYMLVKNNKKSFPLDRKLISHTLTKKN